MVSFNLKMKFIICLWPFLISYNFCWVFLGEPVASDRIGSIYWSIVTQIPDALSPWLSLIHKHLKSDHSYSLILVQRLENQPCKQLLIFIYSSTFLTGLSLSLSLVLHACTCFKLHVCQLLIEVLNNLQEKQYKTNGWMKKLTPHSNKLIRELRFSGRPRTCKFLMPVPPTRLSATSNTDYGWPSASVLEEIQIQILVNIGTNHLNCEHLWTLIFMICDCMSTLRLSGVCNNISLEKKKKKLPLSCSIFLDK